MLHKGNAVNEETMVADQEIGVGQVVGDSAMGLRRSTRKRKVERIDDRSDMTLFS